MEITKFTNMNKLCNYIYRIKTSDFNVGDVDFNFENFINYEYSFRKKGNGSVGVLFGSRAWESHWTNHRDSRYNNFHNNLNSDHWFNEIDIYQQKNTIEESAVSKGKFNFFIIPGNYFSKGYTLKYYTLYSLYEYCYLPLNYLASLLIGINEIVNDTSITTDEIKDLRDNWCSNTDGRFLFNYELKFKIDGLTEDMSSTIIQNVKSIVEKEKDLKKDPFLFIEKNKNLSPSFHKFIDDKIEEMYNIHDYGFVREYLKYDIYLKPINSTINDNITKFNMDPSIFTVHIPKVVFGNDVLELNEKGVQIDDSYYIHPYHGPLKNYLLSEIQKYDKKYSIAFLQERNMNIIPSYKYRDKYVYVNRSIFNYFQYGYSIEQDGINIDSFNKIQEFNILTVPQDFVPLCNVTFDINYLLCQQLSSCDFILKDKRNEMAGGPVDKFRRYFAIETLLKERILNEFLRKGIEVSKSKLLYYIQNNIYLKEDFQPNKDYLYGFFTDEICKIFYTPISKNYNESTNVFSFINMNGKDASRDSNEDCLMEYLFNDLIKVQWTNISIHNTDKSTTKRNLVSKYSNKKISYSNINSISKYEFEPVDYIDSYDEITECLNNYFLDDKILRWDGTGTLEGYPFELFEENYSIREMYQSFISFLCKHSHEYEKFNLMLTGGDAWRRYLDDINLSSDIDVKIHSDERYFGLKTYIALSEFTKLLNNDSQTIYQFTHEEDIWMCEMDGSYLDFYEYTLRKLYSCVGKHSDLDTTNNFSINYYLNIEEDIFKTNSRTANLPYVCPNTKDSPYWRDFLLVSGDTLITKEIKYTSKHFYGKLGMDFITKQCDSISSDRSIEENNFIKNLKLLDCNTFLNEDIILTFSDTIAFLDLASDFNTLAQYIHFSKEASIKSRLLNDDSLNTKPVINSYPTSVDIPYFSWLIYDLLVLLDPRDSLINRSLITNKSHKDIKRLKLIVNKFKQIFYTFKLRPSWSQAGSSESRGRDNWISIFGISIHNYFFYIYMLEKIIKYGEIKCGDLPNSIEITKLFSYIYIYGYENVSENYIKEVGYLQSINIDLNNAYLEYLDTLDLCYIMVFPNCEHPMTHVIKIDREFDYGFKGKKTWEEGMNKLYSTYYNFFRSEEYYQLLYNESENLNEIMSDDLITKNKNVNLDLDFCEKLFETDAKFMYANITFISMFLFEKDLYRLHNYENLKEIGWFTDWDKCKDKETWKLSSEIIKIPTILQQHNFTRYAFPWYCILVDNGIDGMPSFFQSTFEEDTVRLLKLYDNIIDYQVYPDAPLIYNESIHKFIIDTYKRVDMINLYDELYSNLSPHYTILNKTTTYNGEPVSLQVPHLYGKYELYGDIVDWDENSLKKFISLFNYYSITKLLECLGIQEPTYSYRSKEAGMNIGDIPKDLLKHESDNRDKVFRLYIGNIGEPETDIYFYATLIYLMESVGLISESYYSEDREAYGLPNIKSYLTTCSINQYINDIWETIKSPYELLNNWNVNTQDVLPLTKKYKVKRNQYLPQNDASTCEWNAISGGNRSKNRKSRRTFRKKVRRTMKKKIRRTVKKIQKNKFD